MPDLGFNTDEYTGNFTSQAIPNGRYKVVIGSSEKVATRSGNGSMLKLTLTVVEGEYAGSRVFVNLNLWHTTSQAAVRIAREEMTAISHACCVSKPTCSEQLHNIPFFADVVCEKSSRDPDRMVNRVTAYYSIRQQSAAQAPAPAMDTAPYKRSGTGAPTGGWGAPQTAMTGDEPF